MARSADRLVVSSFVHDLSKESSSDNVFNPWSTADPKYDLDGAHIIRGGLLSRFMGDRVPTFLLVGLAPGYAGAKFSGIPLVDERHVVAWYGQRTSARHQPWAEHTASVVIAALKEYDILGETMMWNVFPFHPHEKEQPLTNRTPDAEELARGLTWLERFTRSFPPGIVIPVGRVAEKGVREIELPKGSVIAPYVRHPSHNGETAFRNGLWSIVNQAKKN